MSITTFAAPHGIQNYGTPAEFKAALDAIYHFDDYDPCALNPEGLRRKDGLGETPNWVKSYFENPPYGNVVPWMEKAIQDKRRGKTAVLLLRVDCSTSWMHDLLFPYARPIWVRGRLRFRRPGACLACHKKSCRLSKHKDCKVGDCQSVKGHPSPFASVVAAYEPGAFFPPQSVMWQDQSGVWHISPKCLSTPAPATKEA